MNFRAVDLYGQVLLVAPQVAKACLVSTTCFLRFDCASLSGDCCTQAVVVTSAIALARGQQWVDAKVPYCQVRLNRLLFEPSFDLCKGGEWASRSRLGLCVGLHKSQQPCLGCVSQRLLGVRVVGVGTAVAGSIDKRSRARCD
jgi:hypothetical protein